MSACDQQKGLSPEEARAIAKEAYLYGFPMVVNFKTMYSYTLDQRNPKYKGPFNFLACDARLLTPEDKTIVSPNSDTPECYMWGDLGKEPVVITVPTVEPFPEEKELMERFARLNIGKVSGQGSF